MTPGKQDSERYMAAVGNFAAEPVPLIAGEASWSEVLASLDGLLLTGGGDVDPRRYHVGDCAVCKGVNAERDRLELDALQFCLNCGLPVLAICRGMQLVNVHFEGALVPDIRSTIEHRAREGQSSCHSMEVSEGTLLSAILGSHGPLEVNSRHHQGVDLGRVAPGLRVSALAPDGIVEGLELNGEGFLVAVQCHPERLDEVSHLAPLFEVLVARARQRG